MTWLASRPTDETKALREIAPVARALIHALEVLREKEVDTAAPEVQALVTMRMEGLIDNGAAPRLSPEASDFIDAARELSAKTQAVKSLLDDTSKLMREHVDAASPRALSLVQRFRDICTTYGLGDCVIYAQWAHFSLSLNPSKTPVGLLEAWAFLAKAAHAQNSRGKTAALEG